MKGFSESKVAGYSIVLLAHKESYVYILQILLYNYFIEPRFLQEYCISVNLWVFENRKFAMCVYMLQ